MSSDRDERVNDLANTVGGALQAELDVAEGEPISMMTIAEVIAALGVFAGRLIHCVRTEDREAMLGLLRATAAETARYKDERASTGKGRLQ
jgi:hypothetical protein